MILEEEIFKKYTIHTDKLKRYGFKLKDKKLLFETNLANGDFKVIIQFDGQIQGKIFDSSTQEEYTNFRIKSSNGFSSEVREEYTNLLIDIREKCAENQLFLTKQAQSINKYIFKKYKDEPEFLWKNLPTYAIFRNKKNKKWYAIIGTVPLNKIDNRSTSDEIVEIMNVKVDKDEITELLNKEGIYEAYHMNKKNWITMIFDETLKNSEIENLIDKSYKNVNCEAK